MKKFKVKTRFVAFIMMAVVVITASMLLFLAKSAGATGVCTVPTLAYHTIQEALDDPVCQTIELAEVVFWENLTVNRNVILTAAESGKGVIDGQELGSVIVIQPGLTVTITQVTITNGRADQGGGIYNDGSQLFLEGVEFLSNQSLSGSYIDGGGAIFIGEGGKLIADSCVFSDNRSSYGTVRINGDATATILKSTFSANLANGVYIMSGGVFTVTGSTFSDSQYSPLNNDGTMLVENSEFYGNRATTIYNNGTATIRGSLIHDNWRENQYFSGATVENRNNLTLENSHISYNSGPAIGGTYSKQMLIKDSIIEGNYGSVGGVHVGSGNAEIVNTIIRGNTSTSHGGGGIRNDGMLILTKSLVTANKTTGGSGGGIFNPGGILLVQESTISGNWSWFNSTGAVGGGIAGGNITILNSLLVDNWAGFRGGAIYNDGVLDIINSTLSANVAGERGGAIWNKDARTTIRSSTLTANIAHRGAAIYSSDVNSPSSVTMVNSIIAGNIDGTDCDALDLGNLVSHGHNIDSDYSCNLNATGDKSGINPIVGRLRNNGGPTLTHALLAGSPAIDKGDNGNCESRDQRGYYRPVDGNGDGVARCDIGAFEYGSAP